MPRYAAAGKTLDDLKKKISSLSDDPTSEDAIGDGLYEVLECNKPGASKLVKDLKKINVNFENVGMITDFEMPGLEDLSRFDTINGFPVIWCGAGGDWQDPLAFCVYIGDNGALRGYIPSEGNAYDHEHKSAYGEDIKLDDLSEDERKEIYKFDPVKLRADAAARIQINGSASASVVRKVTFSSNPVVFAKVKFVKDIPQCQIKKFDVLEVEINPADWDPDCMDEVSNTVELAVMRALRQLGWKNAPYPHMYYNMSDDIVFDEEFENEFDEDDEDPDNDIPSIASEKEHGSVYDKKHETIDHSKNDRITDETFVLLNLQEVFDGMNNADPDDFKPTDEDEYEDDSDEDSSCPSSHSCPSCSSGTKTTIIDIFGDSEPAPVVEKTPRDILVEKLESMLENEISDVLNGDYDERCDIMSDFENVINRIKDFKSEEN